MRYRRDTCFTEDTRAIMKELNDVIVCRASGLALDYLSEYLGQFDSLPQDLIDVLKINIVIASGPRLFFSKYFRHHFLMIDVSCSAELVLFRRSEKSIKVKKRLVFAFLSEL